MFFCGDRASFHPLLLQVGLPPASFIPRDNGVEARQRTADIRIGTDLRVHGLRWNPPHPIQVVGQEARTFFLYFEQSRAITHRRSALGIAYSSPTQRYAVERPRGLASARVSQSSKSCEVRKLR